MARSPRSQLSFSILSILSERPMHPYEMRQTAIRRKHDRVMSMPGGSFYSAVNRLEADGLVVPIGTNREGRRPERTVYEITPKGEAELLQWLRNSIVHPADEFPQFASAIAFFPHLMPTEVAQLLRERLANLNRAIASTESMLAEPFWAKLPRTFRLHEDYNLTMRLSERDWVTTLIDDIESQRLTWPPVVVAWHQRRGTWTEDPTTSPSRPESDSSPVAELPEEPQS